METSNLSKFQDSSKFSRKKKHILPNTYLVMRKLKERMCRNEAFQNKNIENIRQNQDKAFKYVRNLCRINHNEIKKNNPENIDPHYDVNYMMSDIRSSERQNEKEKDFYENQFIDIHDLEFNVRKYIENQEYLKQNHLSKILIYQYVASLDKYTLVQLSTRLNDYIMNNSEVIRDTKLDIYDKIEKDKLNEKGYNFVLKPDIRNKIDLQELKRMCEDINNNISDGFGMCIG